MENIYYEYFHDKDTKLTILKNAATYVPTHFHKSIELVYVLDGEMDCVVGNERFTAKKDDIVFVHNYYAHNFTAETVCNQYVAIIPDDYSYEIQKILSDATLPALLSIATFNQQLLPLFQLLFQERQTLPTLVKKGYLNVIMGILFSHYPLKQIERNANLDLMVKVLNYIDERYFEDLSLDSISLHFGYNKYYFSRLFHKYIGENITNYINVVRLQYFIRKSKAYKDAPISQLAFDCGFDSLTTFYRCFKKTYQKTPKEYFSQRR